MNIQHIVEQPDKDGEHRQLVYEFLLLGGYSSSLRVNFCRYFEQGRKSKRHLWKSIRVWDHVDDYAVRHLSIEKPTISPSIIAAVIAKIIGSIEIVE